MTRSEQRCAFTFALAALIVWAKGQGYDLAFDEVKTDPAEDDDHLSEEKGGKHPVGLAADLNLYIDGVWQKDTAAHAPIGERWEAMGGVWGGRFKDGNHYEWRTPK